MKAKMQVSENYLIVFVKYSSNVKFSHKHIVLILLNFSYCDSTRVLITVTRTRHMRRPCDFHFMIAMQKFTGKRHLAPHREDEQKSFFLLKCV